MDAVIEPADLRDEIARRFQAASTRVREWPAKHNAVTPV